MRHRAAAIAALSLLALAACSDEEPAAPDAAAASACGDLFGTAPVYMPCTADGDTCTFYTRGPSRTCEAICADFGAACASSWPAEDSCLMTGPDQSCRFPNPAQICACLHP